MNKLAIRRRMYKVGSKPIEYPGRLRFDFPTTTANEQVNFGYYAWECIYSILLDGEDIPVNSVKNGSSITITIPNVGNHIIYFGFFKNFSYQNMNFQHYCSYVRFPYNARTIFGSYRVDQNSNRNYAWDKIDCLDDSGALWALTSYWNPIQFAAEVNVPIGAKQYYENQQYINQTNLDKIHEVKFNYKV